MVCPVESSAFETFSNLKKQGKVVFIPYITAVDPDLSTTAEALKVLDSCGSDIFELGVPYSDPLADGPVIQAAASRSLARKAALTAAPGLGIAAALSNLKKQGKVSFVPYITAGDPDLSTTAEALKMLDSCGSDIFELGVPYSDPLADGPVIQAAASRSLARKAALTAAPGLGIAATLSNLKKQGKVSFIPYITAGDPDLSTTAEALKMLDSCGSDIFELGVPYSDPLADGPVIQAAASRSLARKAALTAAPGLGIAATLSNLKKQGKVSFIPYITAGDPDLSTTAEALKMLDSCGSDIFELGVPYSDPLADGPVIQAAASRSLARKAALTAAPGLGIAATLSNLKKQGKVSFIPYITAGDQDLSTTAEALKMLDSDIIELGVPYSDPLADGPVIQAAASLFLARGANFDAITSMLKEVVRQVSSPVALFTTEQPLKAEKAYIGDSGPVPMEIDIPEDPHHVQWNNLFYGRCYIKGKLCSVVIDGGSSTNIIAEPLCNYLNLPLVRLPKPLALHGIYGGAGKAITHQAWATFTVGDYVDTHQFVVVPTSSVEVLLGRPWISKMDVTHHGRANVYDIKKDGMPIRLYPLTPVEIAELQNEIKESRAQDRS